MVIRETAIPTPLSHDDSSQSVAAGTATELFQGRAGGRVKLFVATRSTSNDFFWDRAPLYSPRHSPRGPVRPALDAGGIAGDTECTDSAGILSQRRSHDTDDWLPAVPIDARRQNIRDCSTERRDEVDRIDARNPLADKYGSGTCSRLDSIDDLRNADGGPRELRIPKRSSLVAKLLTSQQGVSSNNTSR